MKTDPKTEIDRALYEAGRIPGWNFRTVPIRRFQIADCELVIVPAKIFFEGRRRKQAAAAWCVEYRPGAA